MERSEGRVTAFNRGVATQSGDRKGAVSNALSDTVWTYGSGPNALIAPLIDVDRACQQVNCTQALRPVIDAVVTNVHLMGHTLEPLRTPSTDSEQVEAEQEQRMIERFFRHASPKLSWPELRWRFGKDKETAGYALYEALRNTAGDIVGLSHRPSRTFRMTVESDVVTTTFREFDEDKGEWIDREYDERFHVWVQQTNGRRRYFREWGDPRLLDAKSGRVIEKVGSRVPYTVKEFRDGQVPKELLKDFTLANEVIWQCTYDPLSDYGMPAFIGLWNDTESDYYASDATRDYLVDGGIPKLLLVVLAGLFGKTAMKNLEDAFNGAKGKHAQNRVVVAEAAPIIGKSDQPGVSAEAKTVGFQAIKLNDLLQGDALFSQFRRDHHKRIRVSRRLPGMFVGEDDQANFATADVQIQMATQQLFGPEQRQFDEMINSTIMPALNATWWRFRSLGPTIEENRSWVEVVRIAIESGAIPDYPTLRRVLAEVLGYELPSGDKEGNLAEWEKMPPGFVKLLFQAVQGFPGFEDLADTLSDVSEPTGDEVQRSTAVRLGRGSRVTDRMVDRAVELMLAVAPKVRARLASLAGGE